MGKYTKEQLEIAVRQSVSLAEVFRRLGKKWSGGQQQNLKRWLARFEIDTSHFLGKRTNSGKRHVGGARKREWQEILVVDCSIDWRCKTRLLRRALLESGRPYSCETCGLGEVWRDAPLSLQIDHKNEDWRDNRPANLRFLCPNCHSQTQGWSGRK